MKPYQNEKIEKIVNHYKYENQREIFAEECAEAIQALQKIKRARTIEARVHFIEEVADVLITAEQMRKYLGEHVVDIAIDMKLERQLKRMASEGKAVWEE